MEAFPSNGNMAESATSAFTRSRAAFELKGVMTSLTVIRLKSRDLNLIERQLRAKVTQFPQFFQNSPVVLDVSEIEGGVAGFPLAALVRALHVCRVVPVAVTNIDDANRGMALAAGLGVVALSAARPAGDPESADGGHRPASDSRDTVRVDRREIDARAERAERVERERAERGEPMNRGYQANQPNHNGDRQPTPNPQPRTPGPSTRTVPPPPPSPARAATVTQLPPTNAHRPPLVIRQPVRSGQQVYAEKSDMIVLAPVNPGAQLIADGNIHIYAPLRGRAVAGAKGFTEARIFCQRLEAELVAISGSYATSEDIPRERLGKPAQVYLQDGKVFITAL